MAIKIINSSAELHSGKFDLMMTDPPFEMCGLKLNDAIKRYEIKHLVLVSSMRQLLTFSKVTEMEFCFDFVLDTVSQERSMSYKSPNYAHNTGTYWKAKGRKSAFNRKLRARQDVFFDNHYWPTLFRAPKGSDMVKREHGYAKNTQAWTDILGSFEVKSVVDIFAGSGVTGLAAAELDLDCTLIEREGEHCKTAYKLLKFVGASVELASDTKKADSSSGE